MFGNINKLNDDAHAAFLKGEREKRQKEREALTKGQVGNVPARSTAGGRHARVCQSV